MAWLSQLSAQLLADPDDRTLMQARIVAAAGGDGAALIEACRLIGEASDPAEAIEALQTPPDDSVLTAVCALVIRCFATVRMDYPSRQDAAAARGELGRWAEAVYPGVGEALGHVVLDWIVRLVGVAVVELSAIAATRAPLVRVETGISLPSSLLAFDLYGDPSRGAELIDRNRSRTPLIMPAAFEALAD